MKASILQKCGFALLLASVPFFDGCDQRANSAPVNETVAQVDNTQPSDTAPMASDAAATNDTAAANADANLENANGKVISTPDTAAATNTSTNPQLTDFVKLVQAGVGESVLLAYVTNSPTAFNVSSDDILYLNDLGAPESVVSAMLQKDKQFNSGAGATAATAPPAPPVTTPPPAYDNSTPAPGSGAPPTEMEANAMAQTPPLTPSPEVEQEVQQEPNASYSYFYDSLAPYGNWVNIDGYGPCWQPTVVAVNSGWQPYCDRGHWAYTDCGWCWVSDYSWGWAPFHYGRWFHNTRFGWCWAPDTIWGPAWVSWRYSDAYCGWAPLPPSACYRPGFGFTYYGRSVGFNFTFGLAANHFTFVGIDHFHDHYPAHYRVDHREVTKIYNTTVINNQIIRGNNNTLINRGVPVDRVAAATHTEIRPIHIRADAEAPRTAQLGRDGRSLTVYRPALPTPKTGQAPRFVGEGVKPAPNFNLHSRVEQNQARAVSARTPAVNNTPENRPIIGNPNVNRPTENTIRGGQPGAENQNPLITRVPNRQAPARDQNGGQTPPGTFRPGQETPPNSPTQPDRGENNRRTVTPPLQPIQPHASEQNPAQNFNQSAADQRRNEAEQQRQQRQLLQQQQQLLQQQQRNALQQQQQIQQQQQRNFEAQPVAPRQEAPASGSPRMMETRPAPEMRSTPPQNSAPATHQDGGGNGNENGNGNGNGRNNRGQ